MTDISDVQVAVGLDGRHIDGRMTPGEASPRTRIRRARAMEVGQEIRKAAGGSSVVYLARQDAPYFVALSTNCRYPTATFLYRSARTTDAASLVSLQENLACLRDPAATFLVLQPAMIDPSRAVPMVRDTVAAHFDCRRPTIRAGSYILCPRR